MIKFILILVAVSSWSSIFIYFWRAQIFAWLDNRFGKTVTPNHHIEETDEPVDYDAPLFPAQKKPQPETENENDSSAPPPSLHS